jgi:hypothetical protein
LFFPVRLEVKSSSSFAFHNTLFFSLKMKVLSPLLAAALVLGGVSAQFNDGVSIEMVDDDE